MQDKGERKMHPTDNEIETAIKTLEGVLEAARNSNHAGEVALMKAFSVVVGTHVPMPKEPNHAILTELYGVYLSASAHETRIQGYQSALAKQTEMAFS